MSTCLRFSVFFGVFVCLATPALARQDPIPKPSGIVVHLFGPGSITSNMLPTSPGGGGESSANSVSQPAAAQPYIEPTMHDVLHQMFVTGDPNQQPGEALAKGKSNNPLSQ